MSEISSSAVGGRNNPVSLTKRLECELTCVANSTIHVAKLHATWTRCGRIVLDKSDKWFGLQINNSVVKLTEPTCTPSSYLALLQLGPKMIGTG